MSLRWGADDDTLSLGMDASGKDMESKDTAMDRADLDAWDKSQRRRAVKRDKSGKAAALGQQKDIMSKVYLDSATNMAQAFTMGLGAAGPKAQHSTVVGQQAGVGAKQANVAGKIEAGGKGFFGNRQDVLQNRQIRLDARQSRLADRRLAMEEANPYLTKYD